MATVLIVDREIAGTNALTQALSQHGMTSTVLSNGQEALEWARQHQPEAIVLSVELAGTSGYAICNRLKKDDALQKIPLLLASSEASQEVFEEHRRLKTRADGYVFKPYDVADVLQQLQSALDPASAPLSAEHNDPLMSTDALLLLEGSVDVNKHTQVIRLPMSAQGEQAKDLIGAALADIDVHATAALSAVESRLQQLEETVREQASRLADQSTLMTQLTDALARSEAREHKRLQELSDALQGSMQLCLNAVASNAESHAST